MMTVNDFELDILTQKIEKGTQSNEEFLMEGVFDLMVSVEEDPQSVGSGNLESWLKKKKGRPTDPVFQSSRGLPFTEFLFPWGDHDLQSPRTECE